MSGDSAEDFLHSSEHACLVSPSKAGERACAIDEQVGKWKDDEGAHMGRPVHDRFCVNVSRCSFRGVANRLVCMTLVLSHAHN